jgi:hypothetical protein
LMSFPNQKMGEFGEIISQRVLHEKRRSCWSQVHGFSSSQKLPKSSQKIWKNHQSSSTQVFWIRQNLHQVCLQKSSICSNCVTVRRQQNISWRQ